MRLEGLIRRLEEIAAPVESQPGHWFSSEFEDAGLDWCRTCGEARVEELRAEHPDVFLDGGWTQEHDSPPYCERCRARLDYSPTNYCTEQELDHFHSTRFRKLCPETAYDLAQLLGVAEYVKDQDALAVVVRRTRRALTWETRRAAAKRAKRRAA